MKTLSILENIEVLKKQRSQFEKEILKLEGSLNVFESLLKNGVTEISLPEDNNEVIDNIVRP